ncbi:hypothetical protein EV127DRAFT_484628 [Xylaria flabelliformis]|nr:hypothetical protein EV127DRAFT_484628 [Xylaria flabelliformis]
MPDFLRPQTYPYAGSSTGPYRGLLVRKYPCWDAQGPARDIFMKDIAGKIKACLEQCLPESNSFVGFSLFMVGKLPEKTKPTIMIVSDDKPRRKAAFQIVKSKNILATGFELGHCSVAAEFEDLKQLGSDTALPTSSILCEDVPYLDDEFEPGAEVRGLLSTEVCALEYPSWREPTRLYFQTSPNSHSHDAATATCGGLLQIENELYALTMAHAIHPIRQTITSPEPRDDSSSQSDDFEITGMDDWDEDEEDTKTLTAITSPGSKTSSENSDSEESLLKHCDSHLSSETGIKSRGGIGSSMAHEEDCLAEHYEESEDDEDVDDIFDMCEPIGSIVSVDEALDIAVIKMKPNKLMTGSFFGVITTRLPVDSDPTDTSIVIKTTHHPEIRGERSTMPFYTRLPGKSNFLELYSVQLSTPVRHGDSGSWAFSDDGKLVGFVIAGNPKIGSCLLLPSRPSLLSVQSLLRNRESSAEPGSVNWSSQSIDAVSPRLLDEWESNYDGNRQPFRRKPSVVVQSHPPQRGDQFSEFFDTLDEDTMTVGSSLPPSLFSHRMGRGTTPSTMASSTLSTGYEHIPGNSLAQENFLRSDAGSASSFVNKENFLEGQAARLRRELERAWEIIQEKDKRLQEFTTGERDPKLGTSTDDSLSLASGRHPRLEFGQDLSREPFSPSEQLHYRPAPTLTASREASPEKTNLSTYQLTALETERETKMRTKWLAQVDANEALSRENQELKRGITQAIEAIAKVYVDRKEAANYEGLSKIASDLNNSLHNSADLKVIAGQVRIKKESEHDEIKLIDIPPFPGKPQHIPDHYTPRTQSGQSRIRSKHSRVPRFQRSQLPGTTVELSEEDGED